MNTYIFGYVAIHELKPGTFKFKAKNKSTAERLARMLNPDAILISTITEEEVAATGLPFGVRIL